MTSPTLDLGRYAVARREAEAYLAVTPIWRSSGGVNRPLRATTSATETLDGLRHFFDDVIDTKTVADTTSALVDQLYEQSVVLTRAIAAAERLTVLTEHTRYANDAETLVDRCAYIQRTLRSAQTMILTFCRSQLHISRCHDTAREIISAAVEMMETQPIRAPSHDYGLDEVVLLENVL